MSRRPRRKKRDPKLLLVLFGLAALIVLVLIFIASRPKTSSTTTYLGDIPVQGKTMGYPDAPVLVEDYSDFLCPHCREFAEGPEKKLIEEYVKPGKVRFVFRQFVLSERSLPAANATECAREQNKFWEYHDYLYAHQLTDAPFPTAKLKAYAKELGLNTQQFNRCVDEGKYFDLVMKETSEGYQRGVRGTPTIFVDGKMIEYGMVWENLKAAIEKALQGGK
ncbi:MAG: thioredoxin domain-containing protein [Chloroflexi bacterium]|nr:thioredoxin domain-containing protein [Chloroflexota bacterium]